MGCIVYIVNNCPDWLRHIENARNIRPVGTKGAHPQILTDQLTLSQQGEADYAHHITTAPPPPRFTDPPTALNIVTRTKSIGTRSLHSHL